MSRSKILQPAPLFATPDSMGDLFDYIERFPEAERAQLLVVMGMTWNLASKLVDEAMERVDSAEEEG